MAMAAFTGELICVLQGVRRGRSGMPWRSIDPSAKGMHWKFTIDKLEELDAAGRIYWPPHGTMPQYKRYRDELKGKAVPDIWDDIDRINPVGGERLGYPTQKPVTLLERMIRASSDEGDTVLDPFCGCGTSIDAAQRLKRRWIGIDVTHLAITLIKHRLLDAFGSQATYNVIGEPEAIPDAMTLAAQDPYQFQWWALGLVGARPVEQKKGADQGIDGRIYFHDEQKKGGKTKQIILSVKGGQPKLSELRDLGGVVTREKAQIGVLISLRNPTQPMRKEAAKAGFYTSPWGNHPRLQLLTVAELLDGKGIDYPRAVNVTFKTAPKAKRASPENLALSWDEQES
jgi:hypothetical protein